jgi:antitoxin (DNA-binding transcriptional repressor) of toxin-antitoxin stability system
LTPALGETKVTHIMPATATVRDLRNHFPRVQRLVETEGEVVVTVRGEAKYRLSLHTPLAVRPPPVDYWARLTASQPQPLTAAAARALHEENRGHR